MRNSIALRSLLYTKAVLVSLLILSGCGEEPEYAAQKELNRATAQAAEMINMKKDASAAHSQLQAAIRKAPRNAASRESAVLVSAGLSIARAQQKAAQLKETRRDLEETLNSAAQKVKKVTLLDIETRKLRSFIDQSSQEIDQLDKLITGNGQNPGLEDKLSKLNDELNDLLDRKEKLQNQADDIKGSADQLTDQAWQLEKQINNMPENLKTEEEKKYYKLLNEQKEYELDLLMVQDRINALDKRIALARLNVNEVEQDIRQTRRQIQNIREQRDVNQLQNNLDVLNSRLKEQTGEITNILNNFSASNDKFVTDSVELATQFDEAAGEFSTVRDRNFRTESSTSQADALFGAGITISNLTGFQKASQSRLNALSNALTSTPAGRAKQLAEDCLQNITAHGPKGVEYFNASVKAYESAQQAASGTLECMIIKNRIVAILSSESLSLTIGGQGLSRETADLLNELVDKASQCDPQFDTSVAGRLYSGQLEFVPKMPVDIATFYDQKQEYFRNQIQKMPQQKDQRIAAIENLLQELTNLQSRDRTEYDRALSSIEQQLRNDLAALEAPPGQAPAGGGFGTGFGEPNAF